jgi:copper(I)-binding protein
MLKKYLSVIALLIAASMVAAQCGASPAATSSDPQIKVIEPWARSSPMVNGNGAVYMQLTNEGGSDDALLSAETEVAEVVELHETKMEGDVMKMSQVPNIKVPAGNSVMLKPGGLHVMLIKLKQELVPGEKITLTLNFEKSGPMTIEAEIREIGVDMGKGDAAKGKELFTACSACHGPAGEGVPGLGKDMTQSEFIGEKTDDELVEFIKAGRPASDSLNTTGVNMPPKGGNPALSDEDLYDIVAYMRSLQK